jgi:hypothetical protein
MRLTFAERIGSLRFRRYQHERRGIVETLTKDTVTYVRPVFSLPKPTTRRSRSPSACVRDRPSAKLDRSRPKPRPERHRRSCGKSKHNAR